MADYAIHEETLRDIAGIIRKKDGTQAGIDPATYADRINLMGMLEEKTASGAIATFDDGADDVPIKSLVANLPASLTPYEEVKITHTGKNMLNPATCQVGYIEAGGGIHATTAYRELYSDYIKVKPDTTFTFSGTVNNSEEKWRGIAYYDKDKNFIGRQASVSGTDEHFAIGYRTPSNAVYARCTWRNYSNIESGGSVCPCQFEEGSETEYEPYNGEAYNIEIPNPNPDIFNFAESSYQRGAWKADGTVDPDEWSCRAYKIPIESGSTYDIIGEGFFTLVTYFDANDTFISSETLTKTADFHEAVTIPANCAYLGVSYEGFYVMETKYIKKAFNVYGGSIEAISGQGNNNTSAPIALNSLTWSKTTISGHDAFYANLPNGYMGQGSGILDGDCDTYAITTDTNLGTDRTIRFYYNENFNITRCVIRDDQYASLTGAQFKEAVTGNIVYQLAESAQTDFTFDPVPINSRYGVNNFWADTGDSEITYRSNGAAEYYPAGEGVSF